MSPIVLDENGHVSVNDSMSEEEKAKVEAYNMRADDPSNDEEVIASDEELADDMDDSVEPQFENDIDDEEIDDDLDDSVDDDSVTSDDLESLNDVFD